MKRVLTILAVFLLGTCLMSAVLACTILRPRTEVFPRVFEPEYKLDNVPIRSRLQVTRRWLLSPLRKWCFAPRHYNDCWGPAPARGWQYGPFGFIEEHARSSWPVVVEKAAHDLAVRKLGVKDPELDIQPDYSHPSPKSRWRVIANASGRKRLVMEMDCDQHGNLLSIKH